ncbi:MAG: S8 family serine peptidase [Candidatus Omnitrophica bacterium]|nr:S8 family serine peptidase [Candidatus Omnitrophota bacterium]
MYKYLLSAILFYGAMAISVNAAQNQNRIPSQRVFIVLDQTPALVHQWNSRLQSSSKQLMRIGSDVESDEIRSHRMQMRRISDRIAARCSQKDPLFHIHRTYDLLVSALYCDLDADQRQEIESLPEVLAITPERIFEPCLNKALPLHHAPEAWKILNEDTHAGRGVKIGVLDTGIDITHPMFSGKDFQYPPGFPKGQTGATNGKIIAARHFFNGPQPLPYPVTDISGHGTPVAACAAGNWIPDSPIGPLSGVAPGAWLGNYAVSFLESDVILAMEAAAEDGMDILNCSFKLAAIETPNFSPIQAVLRNLNLLGIVVVGAMGNDNHDHSFSTANFPAAHPDVLAVGGLTNEQIRGSEIKPFDLNLKIVNPSDAAIFSSTATLLQATQPYQFPIRGDFRLLSADLLEDGKYDNLIGASACSRLPRGAAQGAWVLFSHGEETCSITRQISFLRRAVANGAILVDLDAEPLDLPLPIGDCLFPILHISGRENAQAVFNMFSRSDFLNLTVSPHDFRFGRTDPLQVINFTSQGPGLDGLIKPDLMAIGHVFTARMDDYSLAPNFYASGFASFGGTSFSAPIAAGAAALVKQKHPHWSPEQIKAALVNSAQLTENLKRQSVIIRGNGALDAGAALQRNYLVMPPTLSFGAGVDEKIPPTLARTITIESATGAPLDLRLSSEFLPNRDNGSIEFSMQSIHLDPGASSEVAIALTANPIVDAATQILEGHISIINDMANAITTVPFYYSVHLPSRLPAADILFIDDDGGADQQELIISDLQSLSYSVTTWDASQTMYYPGAPESTDIDSLDLFDAIIWFMGDHKRFHFMDEENSDEEIFKQSVEIVFWQRRLVRYLESGRPIWVVGRHIWLTSEGARFNFDDQLFLFQSMMDLNDVREDAPIDFLKPYPEGRLNLLFDNFPAGGNSNPSLDAITPGFDQGRAIPEIISGDGKSIVGISVQTSRYRSMLYTFPVFSLTEAIRTELIDKTIGWLLDYQPLPFEISDVQVNPSDLSPAGLRIIVNDQGFAARSGWRITIGGRELYDVSFNNETQLEGILIDGSLTPGFYELTVISPGGFSVSYSEDVAIGDPVQIHNWRLYE